MFALICQDCNDEATRNVILSYKDVTLISQPDQSDIVVPPKEKKFKGYYNIARHYGWALNTTFKEGFEFVIIVEGKHIIQMFVHFQLVHLLHNHFLYYVITKML